MSSAKSRPFFTLKTSRNEQCYDPLMFMRISYIEKAHNNNNNIIASFLGDIKIQ